MSKCYSCEKKGVYELRKIKMCSKHYIEALEHGANLSFDAYGVCADVLYCRYEQGTVWAYLLLRRDGYRRKWF